MAVQGPPFPGGRSNSCATASITVSTVKHITGCNDSAPGEAAYQEGKGRNEERMKQLTGGVIIYNNECECDGSCVEFQFLSWILHGTTLLDDCIILPTADYLAPCVWWFELVYSCFALYSFHLYITDGQLNACLENSIDEQLEFWKELMWVALFNTYSSFLSSASLSFHILCELPFTVDTYTSIIYCLIFTDIVNLT